MFQVATVSYMTTCDQKEAWMDAPISLMAKFWEGFFLDCGDNRLYFMFKKTSFLENMNGMYLNDLKSSTNSIKLMVLSDIMRFWKPLKQPFPRPCHDLLLQALRKIQTKGKKTQPECRGKVPNFKSSKL